jgi:FdhD protein
MDIYKNCRIVKTRDDVPEVTVDSIAVEKKVKIAVNGRHVLSLYCSPSMVREFIVGIIHSEGLISGEWCAERISIEYGDDIIADVPSSGIVTEGERVITSGCAGGISLSKSLPKGGITDAASFPAETVRRVFREFQKRSEGYKLTGGVHSAALTDGTKILAFAEDIGRHNAVDKVIGYCLLEQISFGGTMMLASGRLSSEIALKCARARIPVLVSRAAPTSLAVDVAIRANLTIVGFVRGDRMNVYSGEQRIAPRPRTTAPIERL